MNLVDLFKLGRRAYTQSIKPYTKGDELGEVAIFGLDTEYVPYERKKSDLICWQLAGETHAELLTIPLNIDTLYSESRKMVTGKINLYVYVCFFSMAEIQFFALEDWQLSEYKGKYKLTQKYGDRRLMIIDLADWFPHQKLAVVAKLWGLKKIQYPIGAMVTKIAKGLKTKDELLADPKFRSYALNDAVIDQRIYVKMREYFLKLGVDILKTMTPANTSASLFRLKVGEPIEQRDTSLRRMALKCCWGGRMEAIFRGFCPYGFEYDATGHHPNSTIALNKLPLEQHWTRTTNLNQWLSGISGLGKVYFKFSESEQYPCLPVWDEDALIFPLEGMSFCSVSEARLAKEFGAKLVLMDGYFYTDGTTVLTKYLQKVQALRNRSTDKAERELLKLQSNSIIGKLFQKRTGVDLRLVQIYAEKHQIPYEEALKVKEVDFGDGNVTIGSCFYPEWYALILGYARASISRMSKQHHALVISSDSFITEENLGQTFIQEGITYNLKQEGEVVVYRTRFYRIGDKLAHHAVHSQQAAQRVLKTFNPDGILRYTYHRFMHLKESWKSKVAFGSRTHRFMTTSLGFDSKRRLEEKDGWSHAWKNVEERGDRIVNF